jgi:hypothetical protein
MAWDVIPVWKLRSGPCGFSGEFSPALPVRLRGWRAGQPRGIRITQDVILGENLVGTTNTDNRSGAAGVCGPAATATIRSLATRHVRSLLDDLIFGRLVQLRHTGAEPRGDPLLALEAAGRGRLRTPDRLDHDLPG